MSPLFQELAKLLNNIVKELPRSRPVIVGGSVRDACEMRNSAEKPEPFIHYLSQIEHDFDVEIFRVQPHELVTALTSLNVPHKLVGDHFPVYSVGSGSIQIAFPRRELKNGTKHTSFSVAIDPDMSFMTAAKRRDFTINTMGFDWLEQHMMDPWHGQIALRKRLLDPVSSAYQDDALRVLRAFRFIGSHGYKPSDALKNMSFFMINELSQYPRERHLDEWLKFMLRAKGENIDAAFDFLRACEALRMYPEIKNLRGVPQQPDHHPEGDVFNHTKLCLAHFFDNVRARLVDDHERLIVGFATLTHDFGKVTTTRIDVQSRKVTAEGHEDAPAARKFLERLFDPKDARVDDIIKLVKAHMRPMSLFNQKDVVGDPAIRRLKIAVGGRLDRLLHVVEADQSGRTPKVPDLEVIEWLGKKASDLGINDTEPIKPILKGRHLLELGLPPGKQYGVILEKMFERQLNGDFGRLEEGIELLKAVVETTAAGGSL